MTVSDAALDGILSSPVKLVIWDLDDTLWSGILSEGPVELADSRCDVVRALNRRGIVNAICSKNDESEARRRLEEAGLWDEFVFARIDWTPKGPRISTLIEDAQLRADNVLFIDDLPSNLEEAKFFSPELQVVGPEILDQLLDLPQLTGKDDSALRGSGSTDCSNRNSRTSGRPCSPTSPSSDRVTSRWRSAVTRWRKRSDSSSWRCGPIS